MIEIRPAHPVAPADLAAVRALHEAVARTTGHAALGDDVWRDLETHGRPGSAGVFARDGDRLNGYAHVLPNDTLQTRTWAAGVVVEPGPGQVPTSTALLQSVRSHVATEGGGEIVLWIFDPDDADDVATAATGFVRSRDLLQMRVPLPLDHAPSWPDGIEVEHFRPNVDDDAWLAVNNRAFHDHPEQGGWTRDTLVARIAEPWFDPAGFLLAWSTITDPPELAGFCWTKTHLPGSDTAGMGEIFVIGVDPSHQGTGLGRALVVAGLASLALHGARTGLLYVDADNGPAVALYTALGFAVHRRDRAYTQVVS